MSCPHYRGPTSFKDSHYANTLSFTYVSRESCIKNRHVHTRTLLQCNTCTHSVLGVTDLRGKQTIGTSINMNSHFRLKHHCVCVWYVPPQSKHIKFNSTKKCGHNCKSTKTVQTQHTYKNEHCSYHLQIRITTYNVTMDAWSTGLN